METYAFSSTAYNFISFPLTKPVILAMIHLKKWVFYRMCYLLTARRGARFFFNIYNIIEVFFAILIISNNHINMKDIIPFKLSIRIIYM